MKTFSVIHRLKFCFPVILLTLMPTMAEAGTFVRFITTSGTIVFQLFDEEMPNSVANFLSYVNTDRYDNTIVHRNAFSGGQPFVIQGGGYTYSDTTGAGTITLDDPIDDEPGGGIAGPSNVRGTIAFAKSGPDTVTSQWFINLNDNSSLDDPNRGDGGFSAFGVVLLSGMNVADDINALPTYNGTALHPFWTNLPLQNFVSNPVQEENFVRITNASVINPNFGDVNFNGQVNQADLAIILNSYGWETGTYWDDGDLDMDGDSDGADLLGWQRAASAASLPAVNAVPEPTALALAACGFAALGFARRRKNTNG